MSPRSSADRSTLQKVEELTLTTPGVIALHPGPWGEAGTYLPGGMYSGIRVDDDRVEVHVTLDVRQELPAVVDDLRDRIATEMGVPVDIVVEDVAVVDDTETADDSKALDGVAVDSTALDGPASGSPAQDGVDDAYAGGSPSDEAPGGNTHRRGRGAGQAYVTQSDAAVSGAAGAGALRAATATPGSPRIEPRTTTSHGVAGHSRPGHDTPNDGG